MIDEQKVCATFDVQSAFYETSERVPEEYEKCKRKQMSSRGHEFTSYTKKERKYTELARKDDAELITFQVNSNGGIGAAAIKTIKQIASLGRGRSLERFVPNAIIAPLMERVRAQAAK